MLQKSIYLYGSILTILFMEYKIRIIIYAKGQLHGSATHITTVNTVESVKWISWNDKGKRPGGIKKGT